jgi:hypothetical protein
MLVSALMKMEKAFLTIETVHKLEHKNSTTVLQTVVASELIILNLSKYGQILKAMSPTVATV